MSETEIVVGVIGVYPAGVVEIAAQVRAAVSEHAPGMDVVVNVEDLFVPGPEADGDVEVTAERVPQDDQ